MNNEIQFILYQLPDEEGRVQVVIKDETIWATQKAMAQLFGVDKSGISRHTCHNNAFLTKKSCFIWKLYLTLHRSSVNRRSFGARYILTYIEPCVFKVPHPSSPLAFS